MNELIRNIEHPNRGPATTQAADGLPRRKWSSDEIQRMIDAGIIAHGERFELVGGELVAMAAKGVRHERIRFKLVRHWGRLAPQAISIAQETPLRLGPHDEPEPEILLIPDGVELEDVRGDTVLLVVEVSKSSLSHDLGLKARVYASFGVREYWVIDAETLDVHVHRQPDPATASFGSVVRYDSTSRVTPLLVPELSVRLADIGIA